MNSADRALQDYLRQRVEFPTQNSLPLAVSAEDFGRMYIHVLYAERVLQALIEELWLLSREALTAQTRFSDFLHTAIEMELHSIEFLSMLWKDGSKEGLENSQKILLRSAQEWETLARNLSAEEYPEFLLHAVELMNELCDNEEELHLRAKDGNRRLLAPVTYRAFDDLDKVFAFDYRDAQIAQSDRGERLYEGGGRGVQTSYASILAVLKHLKLGTGAHLIDLGSGFGRLGLIAGLLRSDLQFTGFEYVPQRVANATDCAERAGVSDRVRFYAQDLGNSEFQIPLADAYYLYDPFSPETFEKVLAQLNKLSWSASMTVVTKADASSWFLKRMGEGNWQSPESHDGATLQFFKSKAGKNLIFR